MTVYTLFGQAATGSSVSADTASYTLGMQFTLSQPATLTGIWFYTASGAGSLPFACAIYQVTGPGTGTIVPGSQNLSPAWSGPAGSGWVKCPYASGPVLSAAAVYKVVVLGGSGGDWYSASGSYWNAGPGGAGLTSGIITAPDNSGGDGGQDTFVATGTLAYPDASFNATSYWVDVEVTTSGGTSHTATAALTVTPSFSAGRARGKYRAGTLTVTPSFSAGRQRGRYRTGHLLVVPAFSAARTAAHVRAASLLVTPSFRAVPSGGAAPARQTGSWWGLDSVLKESREEFDAYVSRPPLACPVDGEPLMPPPATPSGSGIELYCRYCGWQYPRDWVRPQRPQPGTL